MSLRIISVSQLEEASIIDLGIAGFAKSLLDDVAIAQGLKRCLALGGPQTLRFLIDSVSETLFRLPDFARRSYAIAEVADGLIARGDLLEGWEHSEVLGRRRRLVYPAAFSFVSLDHSSALILGVPSENRFQLPSDLHERVVWRGLSCYLELASDVSVGLRAAGLQEVGLADWVRAPETEPAQRLVDHLAARLYGADPSGEVPGLRVMKQTPNNSYYRGRWTTPSDESGLFIGRRPQAYGAELWCVVELNAGEPQRLVDLPFKSSSHAAHDDAWRFQAALDHLAGSPQKYRLDHLNDSVILSVFGPLPSWAQRRLEVLGEWVERQAGTLFSFSIQERDMDATLDFLNKHLWMEAA